MIELGVKDHKRNLHLFPNDTGLQEVLPGRNSKLRYEHLRISADASILYFHL